MQWLAADLAKRRFEKLILAYSLVWIGVIVAVMLTHAFAGWGDGEHLALGVGLALPVWLIPLLSPGPERGRPLAARHSVHFNLWIALFSFLQCYFGSALFFHVLHMEYHFHTRLLLNGTPLFLYFLTVAYFSTYYVVMSILWRAFVTRWPTAPTVARLAVLAALGYCVAFAETAGMANDLLRGYFSYGDKWFVLKYGSLFYGTVFFISLPLVFRLDEDPAAPPPTPRRIAWEVLGANSLVLVCYAVYTELFG